MAERGPEYTDEEIERSLTALALAGGNSARAHILLEQDTKLSRVPPPSTLRDWRNGQHAALYQRIRADRAPEIEKGAIDDYRELVVKGANAQAELLDRLNSEEGLDLKDAVAASSAFKNLAIGTGVAADKTLLLSGRPTHVTEHRDLDQIIGSLARRYGLEAAIDSTAEELALSSEIVETNSGELTAGESPSS